jgi:hypothetical protein
MAVEAPPSDELKKKLNKQNIADFYNSEILSDITLVNP